MTKLEFGSVILGMMGPLENTIKIISDEND